MPHHDAGLDPGPAAKGPAGAPTRSSRPTVGGVARPDWAPVVRLRPPKIAARRNTARGVAQLGRAPALGAGGRGFKSPLPDQPSDGPCRVESRRGPARDPTLLGVLRSFRGPGSLRSRSLVVRSRRALHSGECRSPSGRNDPIGIVTTGAPDARLDHAPTRRVHSRDPGRDRSTFLSRRATATSYRNRCRHPTLGGEHFPARMLSRLKGQTASRCAWLVSPDPREARFGDRRSAFQRPWPDRMTLPGGASSTRV